MSVSNGMLVDLTPPQIINVSTRDGVSYQSEDDQLHFVINFNDPESGILEYRCVVFQDIQVTWLATDLIQFNVGLSHFDLLHDTSV